jgi:hypothetical protein
MHGPTCIFWANLTPFSLKEERWLSDLSGTHWLYHTRLVLMSAMKAALFVHDGGNALVHCSDGWDRTAQVCALAQLLLDPYYRSIDGLRVLVQKDFCAFGHKIKQRLGTVRTALTPARVIMIGLCARRRCSTRTSARPACSSSSRPSTTAASSSRTPSSTTTSSCRRWRWPARAAGTPTSSRTPRRSARRWAGR